MVRSDQAYTSNDTVSDTVPILGMLANATIDLGSKAIKVWLWGPMWTAILELVAGFWEGINNLWISLLEKVSPWAVNLMFIYFIINVVAMVNLTFKSACESVHHTVLLPYCVVRWTKRKCLQICDFISTPSTPSIDPVLAIEGSPAKELLVGRLAEPLVEPFVEELVVTTPKARGKKPRKSETGTGVEVKRSRRSQLS